MGTHVELEAMIENNKPTLLIVDDVAINLGMISDLLHDEYNIKVSKTGAKALEIANLEDQPDLILLDVQMPEMDGYEVCRQLKNNPYTSNIPVIFLTAKNNQRDEEFGLNLGAVDYIYKPYNPAIVKIRVRNHINLKLKSDWLEELSMVDGLTHIPNRRFYETEYDKYFKEVNRHHENLYLMMIDVDDFKLYNDNYGHGKGDECLKKVANALNNNLKRPSDFIARYGGEEFVVLLKDIDEAGAKTLAQKLVDSVSNLNIDHRFSSVCSCVTISVGMAKFNDSQAKKDLLKEADDALYKAKSEGKNIYHYK
ncbi:hypothetical protein JCM30760_24630 [Thiomicrorhabdus hydrogeniphila]